MRVGTVILPQDLISQVVSKYFWAAKSHLKNEFYCIRYKISKLAFILKKDSTSTLFRLLSLQKNK